MIRPHVQDDHLEISRLSVDPKHRKSGIAAALVDKIQRVGAILKVEKIKAETGNGQVAVMAFYHRNNWTEVSIMSNWNIKYHLFLRFHGFTILE